MVPPFKDILVPILRLASQADGQAVQINTAIEGIANEMCDPEDDRDELAIRVNKAVQYLRDADLLQTAGRGRVQITDRGRALHATNPPSHDAIAINGGWAVPICARHGSPRKDSRLRHYFMCDDCADVWVQDAFDGTAALYTGEAVLGYCILCNVERNDIRLRTWFLCDICDRVAKSIGRNHVAEESIIDFWNRNMANVHPELELIQNDLSALHHYGAGNAAGQAPVDFIVQNRQTQQPVFGIENKTGRSAIAEMSNFQLDVSDCDCILHAMRTLQIPVYIIHAQVLEIWTPPTMGFRSVGLWWSDVYQMAANFVETQQRRDESRSAAFFRRGAFADIASWPAAVARDGVFPLVEQFAAEQIPAMYR